MKTLQTPSSEGDALGALRTCSRPITHAYPWAAMASCFTLDKACQHGNAKVRSENSFKSRLETTVVVVVAGYVCGSGCRVVLILHLFSFTPYSKVL